MADEVKTIIIRVDASKAVDGSASATRALERIERSTGAVASSMDRLESVARNLLGGYLGTQGVRAIISAADAFTKFENALRTAGTSAGEMAAVSGRLFAAANRNGVEIGALSTLYSRAAMAATELGASQDKLLKFVDGVTAGLRLQGGSTESASGALLQLSQALGSGIVRAEEFNSILEGAFPIAQAAARGIDGMGGSVAKLRAAIANGEVTSAKFFDGLLKGFGQTEREAARMNLTVGQAVTVLQNGFVRLVGEVDKSTGATSGLARMMGHLGESLDDIARKQEMLSGKSQSNWVDDTVAAADRLDAWLQSGANDINRWLVDTIDGLAVAGARGSAMFIEAFKLLPEQLGKLFTDAMNAAIEAVEKGLTTVSGAFADSWLGRQLGATAPTLSLGRLSGGGASLGDYTGGIVAAGDAAAKRMQDAQATGRAWRAADAASVFYGTEAGKPGGLPVGAAPTTPTKGGQALQDRIDKLRRDTSRELEAANAYAAASERGVKAVADLEVHYKALKAAQDAYGDTADKNKDQVAKLTEEIEKQMRATERAKNLKDFNFSTEELERSNVLLAAENALINASAEDRARELALIRLKNDVQAKGLDESNEKEKDAIERRQAAITTNERLKAQGEELKRANELWTEPLKNALQSIQQTAANWIETLLDGLLEGKLAVEDFGKAGIAIAKRMVAEFLSLAVIRPMLGSVIGGLGSIGLVSPGMASSLGYGSGLGGSSVAMPTSGFGGMFGGGGFGGGGGIGSIFPFWNNPISGNLPSGMYGPPAPGQSFSSGWLGDMTWGQGIGAIGGMGAGIAQLVGGKGSTKSTIGGIASMVGAAVSLIPGVGQIAGPIIGLLGSVIPGLFGEEYKWPPLAAGGINFQPQGSGGFFNDEWQTNGGSAIGGGYGWVPSTLTNLLETSGKSVNWGQVSGVGIWSNQREGTTSSFVLNPGGSPSQIGEKDGDATGLIEEAIAKAWAATVARGGVTGVSDSLKTAVNTKPWMEFTSVGQVRQLIAFTEAYDHLGETTTQAEKALKDIDASFAEMTASAKEYGLSLDPIEEEKGKKRKEYAEGILDEIESMFDPVGVALKKFNKERDAGLKELQYIAENVKDVYVDMAKVSEYYARKEEQLRDQLYSGAVDSLEAAIKRLTVGDLANVSPTTQFAGLKATYNATLAQARAGDADAIARLAGEGLAYAEAGRNVHASAPEYQALVEELRTQLAEVQAAIQAPRSGAGGTPLDVQAAEIQAANVNQLAEIVRDQSAQIDDLKNNLATTNQLLRSMISNR